MPHFAKTSGGVNTRLYDRRIAWAKTRQLLKYTFLGAFGIGIVILMKTQLRRL
jgi:hypothetical protein